MKIEGALDGQRRHEKRHEPQEGEVSPGLTDVPEEAHFNPTSSAPV